MSTWTAVSAVAGKQVLEMRRDGLAPACVSLGIALFFEWTVLDRILPMLRDAAAAQYAAMAPALSMSYLPLIVIPVFGQTMLARCHARDLLSGTLALTICTGLNPGILWGAQVATVFVGGCLLTTAAWATAAAMVAVYPGIHLAWNTSSALATLVLSPACALAAVSLLEFCLWTIPFGRIVVSFLTMSLALSILAVSAVRPLAALMAGLTLAVLIGSAAITGLCGFGISRLRRGFIAGM
jgi:hypothetical protein